MASIATNVAKAKAKQGRKLDLDQGAFDAFVKRVEFEIGNRNKLNKVAAGKLAQSYGIDNPNEIKELVELAIVNSARAIIKKGGAYSYTEQTFRNLVDLYNNQMNLAHRTSQSVLLQQYSTPAPVSYLAGLLCVSLVGDNWVGFEPSAGNGLLTIAGTPDHWVVNEIDDFRRNNLMQQGLWFAFKTY